VSLGPRRGNGEEAPRQINLALQGGGSHGAFTWGVLDRLLEDRGFAIDAVSATSAGAVSAVAMAHGVSLGGREGARRKLEELWRAISRKGSVWSPVRTNPFAPWMAFGPWAAFADASAQWMQAAGSLISPYDINPLGLNPLKDVLEEVVDFSHLKTCNVATRLFVAATNVRSGKIRIFGNAEISVEAVLASACLPTLFKAVEIGGEAYWDGGFTGNPAIFPLIYSGASLDVVVVHVNPIRREDVPETASEIRDRINEISFNSSLMREMRAIAFVQKLVAENRLDQGRYKSMRIHDIRDDVGMLAFGADSKFATDWATIERLRDLGHAAASRWLDGPAERVGHESTTALQELYL
jgi:NTE family protein